MNEDKFSYIKYRDEAEYEFDIDEGSFVTFLGEGNKKILDVFLSNRKAILLIDSIEMTNKNKNKIRRDIGYALNDYFDVFVAETVKDEIAFSMENLNLSKDDMITEIEVSSREFKIDDILDSDLRSLGISQKAKVKILCSLIYKPKTLIIKGLLSELDYNDKIRVVNLLKEYVKRGNIVLNFTNEVEESLYGDRIIISDNEKILIDGKTLSVLNEEKLLKRLGIYLPFIVELNRYLMDYEIINKYELDINKLVDRIWK